MRRRVRVQWTTVDFLEGILIGLVLAWGLLLFLPGNSFTDSPRTDIGFIYALDSFWGFVILLISAPVVLSDWGRRRSYRKFAHAFYWVFWFAIFCLLIYRSLHSHFNPAVLLIGLPFLALALLHAVIYAGLGRKV